MRTVLDEIIERKREEVSVRRAKIDDAAIQSRARAAPPARDFLGALRVRSPARDGARLICEFKRSSPSRGAIRPGADPAEIARIYASCGASCLSVLTDERYFGGTLEDLARAREASGLPALRKDFLVDPYQVYETRAAGADAVLLIARCLDDAQLLSFGGIARGLGMAALVEVHDEDEMARAVRLSVELVGVNNRDLATLEISLETTKRLLPRRPPGALFVSESGFSRREEIDAMQEWGVDAFLIGESLLRSPDVAGALTALTGGAVLTGSAVPGGASGKGEP